MLHQIRRVVGKLQSVLFPDTESVVSLDPHYSVTYVDHVACLLPYQELPVSTCIKANKYHYQRPAALALATVLDQFLTAKFGSVAFTVITVPQSYRRWRERGYDHLAHVMRQSAYHQQYASDLLYKRTHTARQAQVPRATRIEQQQGTFGVRSNRVAALPNTVVLLDDVLTTGATMRAAESALKRALPADMRVHCVALAH
jgi:predicted amidophosphoribosyltransferase